MTYVNAPRWSIPLNGLAPRQPLLREGVLYVGIVDVTSEVPATLTALEAATGSVLWSRPTLGTEVSTPVEADGLVYYTSDDVETFGAGHVHAVDARTGAERWHYTFPAEVTTALALSQSLVHVGTADGLISALSSRDATPRWSFPLGGRPSALCVTDGLLLAGTSDMPVLVALDVLTGKERWRLDLAFGVLQLVSRGGITYVLTVDGEEPVGAVVAVDTATGEELWSTSEEGSRLNNLAVDEDFLYVSTEGRDPEEEEPEPSPRKASLPRRAKRLNARGVPAKLLAFSRQDGQRRWDSGGDASVQAMSNPVVADDKVFFGVVRQSTPESATSTVLCLEPRTRHALFQAEQADLMLWMVGGEGALYAYSLDLFSDRGTLCQYDIRGRWRASLPREVLASPLLVGSRLICGSTSGEVVGLSEEEGERRWGYNIGGAVDASPSQDGQSGVCFIGLDSGTLFAVRTEDGEHLWSYPGVFGITSPATREGDLVVFGCRDGALRTLSRQEGRLRWEFTTAGEVHGGVAASDNRLFFGSTGGTLYALDLSGAELWRFSKPGAIHGRPLVAGPLLVFGNSEGVVYGVRASDGERVWQTPLDGAIRASPVRSEGGCLLVTEKGHVHELSIADGTVLRTSPFLGRLTAAPALRRESLYVGSQDGSLYVLDARTLEVRRKLPATAAISGSPTYNEGAVFFCDGEGHVFSIFP